jgi:hypothetical protein
VNGREWGWSKSKNRQSIDFLLISKEISKLHMVHKKVISLWGEKEQSRQVLISHSEQTFPGRWRFCVLPSTPSPPNPSVTRRMTRDQIPVVGAASL